MVLSADARHARANRPYPRCAPELLGRPSVPSPGHSQGTKPLRLGLPLHCACPPWPPRLGDPRTPHTGCPLLLFPNFQVHRLMVVVQLLMGDLPDRAVFREKGLRVALRPHFLLAQAVRVGDLELFNRVLAEHADNFKADSTYTLILRLRNNVIKAGLRKIAVAYSTISFADIAEKLHLGSAEDAEFLAAKVRSRRPCTGCLCSAALTIPLPGVHFFRHRPSRTVLLRRNWTTAAARWYRTTLWTSTRHSNRSKRCTRASSSALTCTTRQ